MTNKTYMTSTEYDVQDMHDIEYSKHWHRYGQNIIKVIFKLSMPFVVYTLIAVSTIITTR